MFSMAQNMHMTSILNNPRLLHHEILGAISHLTLKFEACILLLHKGPGFSQSLSHIMGDEAIIILCHERDM